MGLWYLPLGITHGNETLIEERLAIISGKYIDVWLPLAWAGFFLDIFVLLSFFFFRRQRKFLFVLAGLTVFYQWAHFLRELVKGSPIPIINEIFFWINNKYICSFEYLWVAWVEASEYVLSVGISLIISAVVVRKEQLSYAASHFKVKIIKALILYPLAYCSVIAIILLFFSDFVRKVASCGALNPLPSILGIIELIVAISVNSFILGTGVRSLYTMYTSRTSSSHAHKLFGIFLAIIILQFTPRLGYNIWYLAVAFNIPSGNIQDALWWYSTLSILPSYFLNAILVFVLGFFGHHHIEQEEQRDTNSNTNNTETEMLLRC